MGHFKKKKKKDVSWSSKKSDIVNQSEFGIKTCSVNVALHRILTTQDATSNLGVYTKRDVTESIKYHSQSEACVGGRSLEMPCTRNEMDKFMI